MANLVLNQVETVLAYEPYSEIRQVIGQEVDLKTVFTEEKIRACNALINQARQDFFEITATELNLLERFATAEIVTDQESQGFINAIMGHAQNIRGQAEMLGFALIARICLQISLACVAVHQPQATKRLLITKMVARLRLLTRPYPPHVSAVCHTRMGCRRMVMVVSTGMARCLSLGAW